MTKIKKILAKIFIALVIACIAVCIAVLVINFMVKSSTKDDILFSFNENTVLDEVKLDELKSFNADCIMVLGAGIEDEETPTPMLKDRLDAGIELYQQGVAGKLLLTGDNGQVGHNEIHVMLNYVKAAGIPEEDIFCDHAGFSTFDSMYRASDIFQVQKAIVVTQKYHEYRSIYIANALGLEAIGVSSDQVSYRGQFVRELREILARSKDFFKVRSNATALLAGEVIPISGSGIISHGE